MYKQFEDKIIHILFAFVIVNYLATTVTSMLAKGMTMLVLLIFLCVKKIEVKK